MELALALPIALLATLVVLGAGLVGVEVVAAHSLARDAARAAALDSAAALAHFESGVVDGSAHHVDVSIDFATGQPTSGELVTASVRLRSRALAAIGIEAWLPARATMPVEP